MVLHNYRYSHKQRLVIGLLLCCLSIFDLSGQVPVRDRKHNNFSKVLETVQRTSLAINQRVVLVTEKIKDVQEFMAKASSIVNGVLKNIKLTKSVIREQKEIAELVTQTIDKLNNPLDEEGDGLNDLDFLDKWKHIEILLAIAGEADGVFELFKNVIEQDGTIIDDNGRLRLMAEAYNDTIRIKATIKSQIRSINREIYQYKRKRKELQIWEELFEEF